MSTDLTSNSKIQARFSHMGLVVKDIDMIVDFYTRVIDFERTDGNFWTMYAADSEGTGIEFFADTPWYITQQFLKPVDFNVDEADSIEETERLVRIAPGFTRLEDFYGNLHERVPARESVLC